MKRIIELPKKIKKQEKPLVVSLSNHQVFRYPSIRSGRTKNQYCKKFFATLILLTAVSAYGQGTAAPSLAIAQAPTVQAPIAQTQITQPPITQTQPLADTAEFNREFNEFLLSDRYSRQSTESYWHKKNEAPEPKDPPDLSWLEWLDDLADGLDGIVEGLSFLLKLILVGLLLLVVWWLFRHRKVFVALAQKFTKPKRTTISPQTRHYRPSETLPDDDELARLIEQFIGQGEYQKALSLLYRGSLRALSLVHELPITDSQTERQCQELLAHARTRTPDEVRFFDGLVQAWQHSAYGRIMPSDGEVRTLFGVWRTLYLDKEN